MEIYSEQEAQKHEARAGLEKWEAIAKVYLWFALGLGITGIMAIGYPYLMLSLLGDSENAATAYLVSLAVFAVLYIPLGLATSFASLAKNPTWITVFYILYAVVMGGLISSVSLYLDAATIMYAVLVSAGIFLVMGLLGVWTKGKMAGALIYMVALALGLSIISVFNIFLFGNATMYWIVSVICLLVFMIMAGVDTNRVVQNAESHAFDDNQTMTIYAAYSLYSDFVIIFLYIIRFLAVIAASKKN